MNFNLEENTGALKKSLSLLKKQNFRSVDKFLSPDTRLK